MLPTTWVFALPDMPIETTVSLRRALPRLVALGLLLLALGIPGTGAAQSTPEAEEAPAPPPAAPPPRPRRFDPADEIPEDQSVPFPVDI